MTFFNRKEEVIDLKLTPYGRSQLALGRLDPQFYAFYDDDVLYDGDYAGLVGENQNHIESRIKETPRIRVQPTRTSVYDGSNKIEIMEETIGGFIAGQFTQAEYMNIVTSPSVRQNSIDKNFALLNSLGTSGNNSTYLPSWKLNFHKGIISGSQHYTEISGTGISTTSAQKSPGRIVDPNHPQIDCLAIYETKAPLLAPGEIIDETLVSIGEDFILIGLEEENSEFTSRNFDIELFEVEKKYHPDDGHWTGEEDLIPLLFTPEHYDVLTGDAVSGQTIDSENLTPQHAAYYFNIAADANIDRSKFCQYVNDQSKDVFEDEFIDCGEAKSDLSLYNIYQPSPEDDDTGEIC